MHAITRRTWMKTTSLAVAGSALAAPPKSAPLFDGKTLDGWIPLENAATSVPGADIRDPAAFAKKLAADGRATNLPSTGDVKALTSAITKELNQLIWGPSIYDASRFSKVVLRPDTAHLVKQNPRGWDLARLNKMLLEDAYPGDLAKSVTNGWTVKDGAIASIGAGRGVLYTAKDYGRFRLMFTMRHVSGNPDHQACVLIFCTRPQPGEKPLDALGGIQFQVPKGGHWDYRPGMNNAGAAEFVNVLKPDFDIHDWSRVEIVADSSKGTARMAVAQPVGAKAVEVLDFHDSSAGKSGPIALQMHNAGLIDEYRDITIEVDPREDRLITLA